MADDQVGCRKVVVQRRPVVVQRDLDAARVGRRPSPIPCAGSTTTSAGGVPHMSAGSTGAGPATRPSSYRGVGGVPLPYWTVSAPYPSASSLSRTSGASTASTSASNRVVPTVTKTRRGAMRTYAPRSTRTDTARPTRPSPSRVRVSPQTSSKRDGDHFEQTADFTFFFNQRKDVPNCCCCPVRASLGKSVVFLRGKAACGRCTCAQTLQHVNLRRSPLFPRRFRSTSPHEHGNSHGVRIGWGGRSHTGRC